MGNPTNELRDKLDELGVEWWPSDDPCCEDVITHWCVGPFQWTAIEGEKDLWLNAGIAGHEPLTPEQAIAATVGAGTCHLEECEHEREVPYDLPDCDGGWYTEVTHDCDECGYENADPNIRFCGGCGRKVVTE